MKQREEGFLGRKAPSKRYIQFGSRNLTTLTASSVSQYNSFSSAVGGLLLSAAIEKLKLWAPVINFCFWEAHNCIIHDGKS
ncbi:hypothetical protein L6164_014566 [Bauhinia variegata]|uniref:Uncharacterized protein n=1 Tax=Bauhinia variegata TaxID=167791 RepID=A0ACB9NHS0_BAUVA|nr:hypothetical protein L6164_014566 [Bauhinia variegata]